jgi:hypothetical protein
MFELIKEYKNAITDFQKTLDNFKLETNSTNKIKPDISFTTIISNFTRSNDKSKGIFTNNTSTTVYYNELVKLPEAKSSDPPLVNEFKESTKLLSHKEVIEEILRIDGELHQMILTITNRFQTIRNNLCIACSLCLLYNDNFKYTKDKPQTNNDGNEGTFWYTLYPSPIMLKITNIYSDLREMDHIIKTIYNNFTKIPKLNASVLDNNVLDNLKPRLVKYNINDQIQIIETEYDKYMTEWWDNYKKFVPKYLLKIEDVETKVVTPLYEAIKIFYKFFEDQTTVNGTTFVYVDDKTQTKFQVAESLTAWNKWEIDKNRSMQNAVFENFLAAELLNDDQSKQPIIKNKIERFIAKHTNDIYESYKDSKAQKYDAKYHQLIDNYKHFKLSTDDGPGSFCTKNELAAKVGKAGLILTNGANSLKTKLFDATASGIGSVYYRKSMGTFYNDLQYERQKKNGETKPFVRWVISPLVKPKTSGGKLKKTHAKKQHESKHKTHKLNKL